MKRWVQNLLIGGSAVCLAVSCCLLLSTRLTARQGEGTIQRMTALADQALEDSVDRLNEALTAEAKQHLEMEIFKLYARPEEGEDGQNMVLEFSCRIDAPEGSTLYLSVWPLYGYGTRYWGGETSPFVRPEVYEVQAGEDGLFRLDIPVEYVSFYHEPGVENPFYLTAEIRLPSGEIKRVLPLITVAHLEECAAG